jgi:hypothetical protein
MDACYRSAESKRWEPVDLALWRGGQRAAEAIRLAEYDEQHLLIKEEVMPDGKTKLILKDKQTGAIVQKILE